MINLCPNKSEEDKRLHNQEGLDSLKVITEKHIILPGYHTDNYSSIVSKDGQFDLEKKARDIFKDDNFLPEYIYMPEINQLSVGNETVLHALVLGVYSK